MKRDSQFDRDGGANRIPTIGVPGSARALSKTQKRFNQLVQRLNGQRDELGRWTTYRDVHQRRIAGEWQPLVERHRSQRVAMVSLLDAALDGPELGRRQRDKAGDILLGILQDLLVEREEPALVRLYDKHAPSTFEDAKDEEFAAMRVAASEAFGVDLDEVEGLNSTEDLAAWMDEQRAARTRRPTPEHRSQRPLHARAAAEAARQAQATQAAADGTQSLRDVFRGLASRLHPDREADAAERLRKTELMKEVNQAYKAGDLLRLLELQLAIDQINLGDLGALADGRLKRYVTVLERQSRRLDEQLLALIEPFASAVQGLRPRTLTPQAVELALDADLGELRATLRRLERDLERFQDVRELKRSLQDYRMERDDDVLEVVSVPRRRRPGR